MPQDIDRRSLLTLTTLLAATGSLPALADNATAPSEAPRKGMMAIPPDAPKIAMLIYPKMVALDLIGPMTVFRIMRFDVQLVWKDRNPVSTDVGIPLAATQTFAECPADLDVLFVPGGIMGTIDCMNDAQVRAFLADRGSRAKWVTGVCTGTLALAAAGLLKGYDATSHWTVADLLPLMGAHHVEGRVIRDRNRMTGGGVTAGIDFALALAAEIGGEEAARAVQLTIEYAPEPPFANGTPQQAGPERTVAARERRKGMDAAAKAAAETAAARLGL
ncbi:DJ-1/PfpI family protein [Allorhizobium borbori]|uniref:Putative intracellular protease/amidase n=1 Tax=Allorhizobium borbori TaxID=485907 RepID=A0A7W6K0S0_9HYPH|nr:DJ-1/PfpI family protein [Allorhizobium borbori]MBB4103090.1 putative intracellular protease/amidase [Allorhizobium borbori]